MLKKESLLEGGQAIEAHLLLRTKREQAMQLLKQNRTKKLNVPPVTPVVQNEPASRPSTKERVVGNRTGVGWGVGVEGKRVHCLRKRY